MSRPQIRPLNRVADGTTVSIVTLRGGREFQTRISSMGLHVGSVVQVLHSGGKTGGPTLVAAGETRLAIGQGMAEHVLVAVDSD